MLLVEGAGYSLSEINGREAVATRAVPPTAADRLEAADLSWARRLTLAAALGAGAAGAGPLVVLASAATAFVVFASAAAAETDAPPRVEREKVSSPGMSEKEVWRRLIALDELTYQRQQEIEDETKKAERQSGGLPGV